VLVASIIQSNRFPKSSRLLRRVDFQRVYRQGVRVSGRYIVLFGALCDEDGLAIRLGVTASKKVGNAVVRARSKRRIRELFRQNINMTDESFDIVINAKRGCARVSWTELEKEFHRCLRDLRSRLARRSCSSGSINDGYHHSCRRRVDSDQRVRNTPPRPSGDMES